MYFDYSGFPAYYDVFTPFHNTFVSGGNLTHETGIWTTDMNILKMADSGSEGR